MTFFFYFLLLGWMTTRPLLDIKMVSEKLCWNVIVLLGSGFAIAAACKVSREAFIVSFSKTFL